MSAFASQSHHGQSLGDNESRAQLEGVPNGVLEHIVFPFLTFSFASSSSSASFFFLPTWQPSGVHHPHLIAQPYHLMTCSSQLVLILNLQDPSVHNPQLYTPHPIQPTCFPPRCNMQLNVSGAGCSVTS